MSVTTETKYVFHPHPQAITYPETNVYGETF